MYRSCVFSYLLGVFDLAVCLFFWLLFQQLILGQCISAVWLRSYYICRNDFFRYHHAVADWWNYFNNLDLFARCLQVCFARFFTRCDTNYNFPFRNCFRFNSVCVVYKNGGPFGGVSSNATTKESVSFVSPLLKANKTENDAIAFDVLSKKEPLR